VADPRIHAESLIAPVLTAPATGTGDRRDAGLNRAIGPWGLAAIAANILMGTAFYVVPGEMARLGALSPWALAGCGLALSGVVLVLAEGGSRVPASGGVYALAEAAFGPVAGAAAGGLKLCMLTFAGSGVLAAAADQAAKLAPGLHDPVPRAVFVLACLALFTWNAARGAGESADALKSLVALKLVPPIVFLVVALAFVPASPAAHVAAVAPGGIGKALLLGAFFFFGAESALAVGGETERPSRTIPLGLLGAMGAYTLLGCLIQWTVWRASGPAAIGSGAPLADIVGPVSPVFAVLVVAGGTVAALGCVAGMVVCVPRIVFAYARRGVLPGWLGAVDRRTAAPTRAIVVTATMMAAATFSGGYVVLASIGTVAGIAVYLFGTAASLRLRARGVALGGKPLRLAVTPALAFLGCAGLIAILSTASWREFAWTGAAAALFAGLAWLRGAKAG